MPQDTKTMQYKTKQATTEKMRVAKIYSLSFGNKQGTGSSLKLLTRKKVMFQNKQTNKQKTKHKKN